MQFVLPLCYEASNDHWATLIADDSVADGDCLNWEHAYECAWNFIEENER